MKLVILAALVATCACWPSWSSSYGAEKNHLANKEYKYTSGNEYTYKYNSQVLTGIPTFSKQYAGIRISCNVKVAFASETEAMLQLDGVRLMALNKEIEDPTYLPPSKLIPESQFTPLPSDEAAPVIQKLQIPVKFSYNEFQVTRLEITDEETNWSLDAKRSILSMLQVRLQAKDYTVTQNLPYNKLAQENVTTFDVIESGLEGTCYSSLHVYTCTHKPNYYKVIKARDISRCLKVNNMEYYTRSQSQANCDCSENVNGKPCQCEPVNFYQNKPEPYNKAKTVYEVESEDGQNFVIKKAYQNVEHRMEAPHAPNHFILTTSNQTLEYVESKLTHTIRVGGFSWRTVSKPWGHQILTNDEEKHILTPQQYEQKVTDLLKEIETISEDPTRFNDHYGIFIQLLDTLKFCTQSQLTQLFTAAKSAGTQGNANKQFYAIVNALSYVNTTAADKLLLQKIVSGEVATQEASVVFAVWGAEKVPTVPVLDYLHQTVLPALQKQQGKETEYRSAILCFGSMVRRYIHNEEITLSKCMLTADRTYHQKNIYNCRKYEKYIEGRLVNSQNEEEKITHLNALANIGSIESLQTLQGLLAPTQPKAIRVHAIYAFRNLGYQNQLKVLQTLLPIMLNHFEDSELRMAAFIEVMKCDPSSSLMEVQKHLNEERDVEYKTFVVKYLKNMLNNRQPEYQQRSMRIRQVLKSIRAFPMSPNTGSYQVQFSPDGSSSGDIITFSFLSNETSYYPRTAAYQHQVLHQNRPQQLLEFGYRAEGFEEIMALLKQKYPFSSTTTSTTTTPSYMLSELNVLKDMAKHYMNKEANKPKLTLYAKILGEQVAIAHYDHTKLASLFIEGFRQGKMEIPVSIFQTIDVRPVILKRHEPNGMKTETSMYHMGVIDAQGTFSVTFNGEYPTFTFKTNKNLRHEMYSGCYQKVSVGFAEAELYNWMGSRHHYKSGERTYTYNMENHETTVHNAASNQNDYYQFEMSAVTQTCVWPTQTPKPVTAPTDYCKNLATEETGRRQFSYDVEAFRSVEIEGKLVGSVNRPELYTFIRDRMHLMPTCPSTFMQYISFTARPTSSTPKAYTFKFGGQYLTPSQFEALNLTLPANNTAAPKSESIFGSLFSFWKSTDSLKHSSSEESSSASSEYNHEKMFEPRSIGSLYHHYSASLACVSANQYLNMSANITSYYEHDYPNTRTLVSFYRPPVPSTESEGFSYTNKITSNVNTGTNEVLQAHQMAWGLHSQPTQNRVSVTAKFTPTYKGGVCYEHTAYGCRDAYGVVYPVWYNNSIHIKPENTNLPQQIREYLQPYMFNMAQSVYVFPNNQTNQHSSGSIDLTQIVRPYENTVDYVIYDNEYVMNLTRICAPVTTKVIEYAAQISYPMGRNRLVAGILPTHLRINPYEKKRDVCIYEKPKIYTFDKKELMMPKTDCEVVLVGDCQGHSKELLVTAKLSKSLKAPEALKVIMAGKKIEIHLKDIRSMDKAIIKLNEQIVQQEEHGGYLAFNDTSNNATIAVLQCDKEECKLYSEKYGIYVSVNMDRVKAEVNSDKSIAMCGVCAHRPSLAIYTKSAYTIVKQNLVPGDQCVVEPIKNLTSIIGSADSMCEKLYKHKVITAKIEGELKTCVSVRAQPVCSKHCLRGSRKQEQVDFKCVSLAEAKKLHIIPVMEGDIQIIEDTKIVHRMSAAIPLKLKHSIADSCM